MALGPREQLVVVCGRVGIEVVDMSWILQSGVSSRDSVLGEDHVLQTLAKGLGGIRLGESGEELLGPNVLDGRPGVLGEVDKSLVEVLGVEDSKALRSVGADERRMQVGAKIPST